MYGQQGLGYNFPTQGNLPINLPNVANFGSSNNQNPFYGQLFPDTMSQGGNSIFGQNVQQNNSHSNKNPFTYKG
jgi:hypothetical protein